MHTAGWVLIVALLAPLLSRRLGWDWRPGATPLLWGVPALAAALGLPRIGMVFSGGPPTGLFVLGVVLEVVGVILVFLGITGFRPLDKPA